MKKMFKFLVAMAIIAVVLVLPSLAHAQDSTGSGDAGADVDVWNFLMNFIPHQWRSWIITILTGLFLLEQWLAKNKTLSANSTFQLVGSWVKSIFSSVAPKKK